MAFVSALSLSVATPRVAASATSSFAGARFVRAAAPRAAATIDTTIRAEASKAVPFWERPASLDKSYAGGTQRVGAAAKGGQRGRNRIVTEACVAWRRTREHVSGVLVLNVLRLGHNSWC